MLFIIFFVIILISIIFPSLSYYSALSLRVSISYPLTSTSLYSTIDAASEFGLTPTLNKYVTGIIITLNQLIIVIIIIIVRTSKCS